SAAMRRDVGLRDPPAPTAGWHAAPGCAAAPTPTSRYAARSGGCTPVADAIAHAVNNQIPAPAAVAAGDRNPYADLSPPGARLPPWLPDFSLGVTCGPAQVRAQIDAARRDGIDEFLLWDPGAVYTSAALDPNARPETQGAG